jgi:hypothetical protein
MNDAKNEKKEQPDHSRKKKIYTFAPSLTKKA